MWSTNGSPGFRSGYQILLIPPNGKNYETFGIWGSSHHFETFIFGDAAVTKHLLFFTSTRCPCCHFTVEACAPGRKMVGGLGSCSQKRSFRNKRRLYTVVRINAYFAGLQPLLVPSMWSVDGFVHVKLVQSQEPRRHFFGHTRPIEVLEGSDDGLGDPACP